VAQPALGIDIGRSVRDNLLDELDAWIARQDNKPSRPEGIPPLLAKALAKK
jgi:metal-responsive CopG/Arc/MetJ family transcriptional regulator